MLSYLTGILTASYAGKMQYPYKLGMKVVANFIEMYQTSINPEG